MKPKTIKARQSYGQCGRALERLRRLQTSASGSFATKGRAEP